MTSRAGGHDAVVVGSGPNGLAAAIEIARAGRSVLLLERAATVGGGLRSDELTLPGYVHDVCSSVHALAPVSPFLRSVPLHEHGLEWIVPPAAVAHPLEDGSAPLVERSLEATAARLGPDGPRWTALFEPVLDAWPKLESELLGPLVHVPRAPFALARFGLQALLPATSLARLRLRTPAGRALFAGVAAHSMLPLERPASAAVGLVMTAAAHIGGWPIARGGAQSVADALAAHLRSLGGEIETGVEVRSLDEVPPARAVLLDVTPRQVLALAGDRLPGRYARALERFRYGPGVFKVDWALSAPIPWRAPEAALAATVHLGGTLDELARSERAPWRGETDDAPFVLLTQPSLFDDSRAPDGRHTAWAYCHVPNGATADLTDAIERQVERYAPGFRDVVLARAVAGPAALELRNPNLVGGDVNGGAQLLSQLVARPALRLVPYSTPLDGVYLCSASTPPGGGVHGMCGQLAAQAALRRELR